jgi:hypothetical protein
MAVIGLNLPTDIPWEQVCVTQDMMAKAACETHHPPKWQSSIAVSKYAPEEEYQVYEGRKITYLKVTCSLAGYQPRDKEVEGQINFSGMSVQTVNNIDSLLDAYLPCTGALIQVAVSPHTGLSGAQETALAQYPYFMDFQPKKRELYEMVTDTGERSSRSLESLKVGKASGNSESLEVLDIDQGGSSGGSANVSYAGVGVGGSYQQSSQGQWGSKQLSSQEQSVSRTTDESRERRETDSHTTQLSQMYHLLDTYHLGTNRALFFVQPRPHILEIPTGFVRGPRSVEGIQEFFLVVNEPKDTGGFVVSVRLDTSHLTVIPIMDYDRSRTGSVACKAVADIPTKDDPPDARQTLGLESGGDRVGTAYYNCFKRTAHSSSPYTPPTDYRIDVGNNGGYLDQVNVMSNGTSSVVVDPAGESLTVNCDAASHVCKFEHSDIDVGYNDPDNIGDDTFKWSGSAERDVLVYLISREPTIKTGERNVLLITTRELCCGDSSRYIRRSGIADVISLVGGDDRPVSIPVKAFAMVSPKANRATRLESDPSGATRTMSFDGKQTRGGSVCNGVAGAGTAWATQAGTPAAMPAQPVAAVSGPPVATARITAREANELSGTIREAMVQSIGSRRRDTAEPEAYIDTDLFHLQLQRQHLQTGPGRAILGRSVKSLVSTDTASRLERHYKLSIGEITCGRLSKVPAADLAHISGLTLAETRQLKLKILGVALHETPTPDHPAKKPRGGKSSDEGD